MNRLGLIAGNGGLPLQVSRKATKMGREVVAFALEGETDPNLSSEVSRIHWFSPANVLTFFEKLQSAKLTQVTVVGGIHKLKWMKDLEQLSFFPKGKEKLASHGDHHLFTLLKGFLEAQGIQIVDALEILDIPPTQEANFTETSLTPHQEEDIHFGLGMAKALGNLDIGQTVVVKNKTVLAVEAVEGTDAAIIRGATLGGPGVVVAKVAKPAQDLRFDRPVVGLNTIKMLKEVGAAVLAMEAEKVLFLDQQESVEWAKNAGISIVARKL